MYVYDVDDLLERRQKLRMSFHALWEAYKEGLRGRDILNAIFRGEVIEWYPERDRVLIAGPIRDTDLPVHVVRDYTDKTEIVAVTVYIPNRSTWAGGMVRRNECAK